MKATFNYTGRRKIEHRRVDIRIDPDANRGWRMTARMSLEKGMFPDDAHVYIDLYDNYDYLRVNCGTVGALKLPDEQPLVDPRAGMYRQAHVRVVDETGRHGVLLGATAKGVLIEQTGGSVQSMLPTQPGDIGAEVWRLDLEGDEPVLIFNRALLDEDTAYHVHGQMFHALVYPAVYRRILDELRRRIENDDIGDDGDVWANWLQWTIEIAGMPHPRSDAEDGEWNGWHDEAVNAFCRRAKPLANFRNVAQELLS